MSGNNNQPTYKRQRFLLSFIRQLKDGIQSTYLQKLVFLYTMKGNSEFYEFIPYKFGAYSFQLAEDVDILCRDGYLSKDGTYIQAIGDYNDDKVFPIASERGNNLIRKSYREYPYYTINSKIIDRLFGKEEIEKFKTERQRYDDKNQVMFTIGYEGKSIEEFINILIQNNIRLLCDVRKNPLSRKFGFSKRKLKHITENVGIKYEHMPELGIESSKRYSLDDIDDYKRLFIEYENTLPDLEPQLDYLYTLLSSNVRIALMCFEKEPDKCHRHVIKEYISKMYTIRSVDL